MRDVMILLITVTLITSVVSKIASRPKRLAKKRLLTLQEYLKTRPPINLPRPKPKATVRYPRGHDQLNR